jgi:hypothetical protein
MYTMLAALASLTVGAGISRADILSGCPSCQGATYQLQYNSANTKTIGGETIYDVFLTINTSGYNGGGGYIRDVSIKISDSEDISNSSIVSAPGGSGFWTLEAGGLNAGGCDGNGNGYICAKDSTHAPLPFNGSYTWEFDYAATGGLLTGSGKSDLKVEYTDAAGDKVGGLVSNPITLTACGTAGADSCGGVTTQSAVPEPSSIALLCGILAVAGGAVRRKRA